MLKEYVSGSLDNLGKQKGRLSTYVKENFGQRPIIDSDYEPTKEEQGIINYIRTLPREHRPMYLGGIAGSPESQNDAWYDPESQRISMGDSLAGNGNLSGQNYNPEDTRAFVLSHEMGHGLQYTVPALSDMQQSQIFMKNSGSSRRDNKEYQVDADLTGDAILQIMGRNIKNNRMYMGKVKNRRLPGYYDSEGFWQKDLVDKRVSLLDSLQGVQRDKSAVWGLGISK